MKWKKVARASRKRVLSLGEGPFFYAAAFAESHPHMDILATELRDKAELERTYGEEFLHNLAKLAELDNVEVRFGVDATKLKEQLLPSDHFDVIHFIAPHLPDSKDYDKSALRNLMKDILVGISQVQKVGQHVILGLPEPPEKHYRHQRLARNYGLYQAMQASGYVHDKKFEFKEANYEHRVSNLPGSVPVAARLCRYQLTKEEFSPKQFRRRHPPARHKLLDGEVVENPFSQELQYCTPPDHVQMAPLELEGRSVPLIFVEDTDASDGEEHARVKRRCKGLDRVPTTPVSDLEKNSFFNKQHLPVPPQLNASPPMSVMRPGTKPANGGDW